MERTRTSGLTVVGYAVLAYAAFLVASAWAVTFLADLQLPRGIDHGTQPPVGPAVAIAVDLALLLVFALQHSVMARSGFKHWAARWIPPHVERSTYVLATSLVLLLLFWQWQPVDTPIWDLHGVAAGPIWALYALGWLIAIGSTFMVDHLDVFGLRRAYRHARSRRHPPAAFQERWLYAWVRHPLMLGLLVAFWATPRMTAGHLSSRRLPPATSWSACSSRSTTSSTSWATSTATMPVEFLPSFRCADQPSRVSAKQRSLATR